MLDLGRCFLLAISIYFHCVNGNKLQNMIGRVYFSLIWGVSVSNLRKQIQKQAYKTIQVQLLTKECAFVPLDLNPRLVEKVLLAVKIITSKYTKHANINHSVEFFFYPRDIESCVLLFRNDLGSHSNVAYHTRHSFEFEHFSKNQTKTLTCWFGLVFLNALKAY